MEYECVCGHVIEEHEDKFFRSCTVEGCECDDFESIEDED